MANARSLEKPRTRFTSHNGFVDTEYDGLFEHYWLDRFGLTGLDSSWLHPAGADRPLDSQAWVDAGSLHGCISDGVLILGCLLRGVDESGIVQRRNASRVIRVFDRMVQLCDAAGNGAAKAIVIALGNEVFVHRVGVYCSHGWPISREVLEDLERVESGARSEAERLYDEAVSGKW
jgi:hypothetical protein